MTGSAQKQTLAYREPLVDDIRHQLLSLIIVPFSETWKKWMKKLLIFTGSSLLVLSGLDLIGKFGVMNKMVLDFTCRDVSLYDASFELFVGVGLAILCFTAARKQTKER